MDTSPDKRSARHLDVAETGSKRRLETDATYPVNVDEVWVGGVRYQICEEARKKESYNPETHLYVHDAERPEIFFNLTPDRTVGPSKKVGIRADSDWDVPEPELEIVLYEGKSSTTPLVTT